MKYIFFGLVLCAWLFVYGDSHAQINKKTKIVLNNGVKINGAIIESFGESFLKVRMNSSSEPYLIKYEHIQRITLKGEGVPIDGMEEKIVSIGLKIDSYYHEFRTGLLLGEENISYSFQTINGYQFNQYLGTGLGVGLNTYGNYITLPIYATVKGYLMDGKVSPFYYGDIGYGFAWHNDNTDDAFVIDNVKGGIYWQVGAGYQINFPNNSLVLTLGYVNQYSSADYLYRYWGQEGVSVSEKRLLRRIIFSVGFMF